MSGLFLYIGLLSFSGHKSGDSPLLPLGVINDLRQQDPKKGRKGSFSQVWIATASDTVTKPFGEERYRWIDGSRPRFGATK